MQEVQNEPLERSYLSVLACPDDRLCWARVQEMRALRALGEANRARLVTSCPPAVRARLIQKVSVSLRDLPTGQSPGHEHFSRGSAYEISSYAFKISSQRQRAPGSACRMVSTISFNARGSCKDAVKCLWKLLSRCL